VDWELYIDDPEGKKKKVKRFKKQGIDIHGFYFPLGNLTLYECPPRWITRETVTVLSALTIFEKKNILPVGTSQADLPLWFMEAYKLYINEMKTKQDD